MKEKNPPAPSASPLLSLLVLLAALGFAAAPLVSSGFNGFEPGQFPQPQRAAPVQPAGWAFSIWGAIYLWLIAGAAFGMWRRARADGWRKQRIWLLASLGPGIFWLWLAQISVIWATVLIWWMTVTALLALDRAGKGDRWWQREPAGLYAGWLTAAASVSIGFLLAGYGVMGQTAAALLALALGLGIALWMQGRRRDTAAYPLAVIWALAGVVAANSAPLNWPVLGLAMLGIAALAVRVVRRG